MLSSKSIFDVTVSIKFINFLYESNIENSYKSLVKMQALIWTKEKSIKEELLKTYNNIFFNNKKFGP